MEQFFKKLFLENINRKLFSLLCATVIWFAVSYSITSTRTFTRVPIRVVNLPPDKTIRGLMPTGMLDKKLTLTLTGTKDVVDKLEASDFEVVIDAMDKGDVWVVQISKKNLVSLNHDFDLLHNIEQVSHPEFIVHLSQLVTDKIPITVLAPKGEPPEGYHVLDVWPARLFQVISGPEEDVKNLKDEGLELQLDISSITKEFLDSLRGNELGDSDEVSFFVPESWKKVQIPFLNNTFQTINGQEARHLRIDFLRKEFLPLEEKVPVHLFFPPELSDELNPETVKIVPSELIAFSHGIPFIEKPLYVSEVSKLFIDMVRDRIEIVLVPLKRGNNLTFQWQVQFVDPQQLENTYVTLNLSGNQTSEITSPTSLQLWRQHIIQRERHLRSRFQQYMEQFKLYVEKDIPLMLDATMDKDGKVHIKELASQK